MNYDQATEKAFQGKLERDEERANRWELLRQEKHAELKKMFLDGLDKWPEKTELPYLRLDCERVDTCTIQDCILDMLNKDELMNLLMRVFLAKAVEVVADLNDKLAGQYATDHAGDLATFEMEGEN